MIREVVLKQVVDQNTCIAATYKSNVWDNNSNAVIKINDVKHNNLLQDPDFINFAEQSIKFLKKSSLDATIYDQSGQNFLISKDSDFISIDKNNSESYYSKIFLYLDKYFLSEYVKNQEISRAFNGEIVHSLISRAIITDKYNNHYERSLINSYIPIINSSTGKLNVEGVIKISRDITEQWNNITYS